MVSDRKIVVVDGYTLNPGDLSWDELKQLGDVTVYDRSAPDQVMERAYEAELVLTNKVAWDANTLAQLPNLRYIGVMATGYNVIDLEAAARHGIVVTNVPDYGTDSVAQFTFALLLALCHRVEMHSNAVREGAWSNNPDFSFTLSPQVELAGKRLGIIGFGSIGRRVAVIGQAFGMEVWVASRTKKEVPAGLNIHWTDRETVLSTADVISLHCPLTQDTANLIRRETLEKMKPTAFLINTARGGLVVEEDLAVALNEGRIAGAALDVLVQEPPVNGSPLLNAANCIIAPHMAWAAKEARRRLMATVVQNVRNYIAGQPTNVVTG